MAIAVNNPAQGIRQCFSQEFAQLINRKVSADELPKLFTPEGIYFHVSNETEQELAPELNNTTWKVQMSWHKRQGSDEVDGIFVQATTDTQTAAWIATPRDFQREYRERHFYETVFVHLTDKTIIHSDGEGQIMEYPMQAPELMGIIFGGKKTTGSIINRKMMIYAAVGVVALLALSLIAYKYLGEKKQTDIKV